MLERGRASGQPRVCFLNVVFVRPLPTEALMAPRRLGGVGELVPLGQAAHHVLQPGADDGVVALALSVGGISPGGFWRRLAGPPWRGRLLSARLRELRVGLGDGVCQRAAGLRRGVEGHGGQPSSATSQDLLLRALRLVRGRRCGCWVSFGSLRSRRFTQTEHRDGRVPTSGGAGQTQRFCRFLSGDLRRGGERGFEQEGGVEAVVSDAWESAGVDG